MTTWPSASKATTTHLDSGTDSPRLARPELKQNVDNVNDIIDMFNISSPTNNQILKYSTAAGRFELATDTSTGITLVGDDSTGTLISDGETFKIAGAGTVTTAVSGDTITITGAAESQSLFQTIAVAGQSSVVADTTTDTLTLVAGTGVTITTNSGTDTITIAAGAGTGDLAITGTTISAETTNADITVTSSGTGNFNVDMDTLRIGDSNANATITTNGTGDLILNTNAGSSSGSITIEDAANGEIYITPNGEGYVNLGFGDLKANLRQTNTLTPNNAMVDHGANRVWSQTTDQSAVSANTQRIYANNDLLSVQLTGTTGTNSNNRFRQISQTEVDLNGIVFGYDHTGYKAPIVGRHNVVEIINSSASAATITQAQGANGTCNVGSSNATAQAGDITMTDAIGMSGAVDVLAGTGRTTAVTNAYGQYAFLTVSGAGTKTITNWYGLYAADTSATVTNKYGVYVANPAFNNYIGGLNFANGAISTADSTAIQIDEGVNISGTLNAKIIVANEIASEDSTAIQINDAVNISGALTANSTTRFNSFYTENINALTAGTTITVNAALAPVHKVTLTSNTGFVVTGLPTGGTMTLIITQDGTGTRTATFGTDTSTSVKFAGGAPTLSTAASAIDVVSIFNDGTNYLGNIAKAYA